MTLSARSKTDDREYAIHVCKACGAQCDPDGHWGCAAIGWSHNPDARKEDHGPIIRILVPASLVEDALEEGGS